MSRECKDKGIGVEIVERLKDFSDVKRHILNAEKEVILAGKSVLEVFVGWIDEANAPKKKVEKIEIK